MFTEGLFFLGSFSFLLDSLYLSSVPWMFAGHRFELRNRRLELFFGLDVLGVATYLHILQNAQLFLISLDTLLHAFFQDQLHSLLRVPLLFDVVASAGQSVTFSKLLHFKNWVQTRRRFNILLVCFEPQHLQIVLNINHASPLVLFGSQVIPRYSQLNLVSKL